MGWSADDIPDLAGKIAVVTGATSGLGLEASREFARHGATVIVAARDPDKGRRALDDIKATVPGAALQIRELDLASLDSVRAFAVVVAADHPAIDILLDNAGIMASPPRQTVDGFESQMGTNHLAHFALTAALMPSLAAAPAARVVATTSIARYRGHSLTDEMTRLGAGYDPWQAYADSKLANYHFALELAGHLSAAGSSVQSLAADPGLAHTNLQVATVRAEGAGWQGRAWQLLARTIGVPPEHGCLSLLRAATDPGAGNGELYGLRWRVFGAPVKLGGGEPVGQPSGPSQMWRVSESRTNTIFDIGSSRSPD